MHTDGKKSWALLCPPGQTAVPAVLCGLFCVHDGRGSGLCSVKQRQKRSASPRCHGVWALVGPSVKRTQRAGDGAGGKSARQPSRGRGSGSGDSPGPSLHSAQSPLPRLREASSGLYVLHKDLLCGGAHPQGAGESTGPVRRGWLCITDGQRTLNS